MKTIRNDSYYYDGRKRKWNEDNIEHKDKIEKPNDELVDRWEKEWDKNESFKEKEAALEKIFTMLPNNKDLSDILIKVSVINDFYSTNIFDVLPVAQIILRMKIDERIEIHLGNDTVTANAELVNELSENVYQETGRHCYSFATKYLSHHRPDLYPIYDAYVDKMLRYYRDHGDSLDLPEFKFDDYDLLDYSKFCQIIMNFQEKTGLSKKTVKEIDMMLWQLGKYHFPRYEEIEKET